MTYNFIYFIEFHIVVNQLMCDLVVLLLNDNVIFCLLFSTCIKKYIIIIIIQCIVSMFRLPMDQDMPLFSVLTWNRLEAAAPLPAVRLSPRAATTSMSPGRSLWTLRGGVGERCPSTLQGNLVSAPMLGCSFY